MKAQINGIEIPWSVTTLEQLQQSPGFMELYLHCEDELELIETFTNGFNYLKGQIVEISLTGFGRVPAIVTKVNNRDENDHLTYNIVILLGERNKSAIRSEERYLWRFTEKADENTIKNFNTIIETLFNPNYGYDEFFVKDFEIDTICYLTETSIISYNLNQINPNKPDAGKGLVHNELTKFGFGGTSNKENLCQTQLPKRGQTSSIVNVDECPFTEGKTLSELCGKGVDDNEHY